ncbi:MAG: acetoacetate decarboxylase family protein [Halobellus sp.]|uniref:acetoacetate decarboxylase family protein n=1 Tax=Halobellus sp. TaxID=1979212 RepID=UPI0035D445FC
MSSNDRRETNTPAQGTESAGQESVTISTGHTVELPVRLQATMLGATFAAPKGEVSALLPDRLEPIRATLTGDAAVTLLSVEYHAVDVPGLDPYDEFAVVVPASHTASSNVPYISAMLEATNGYVWAMPVTTAPAKAFGVDVWDYPKEVAAIDHADEGSVRETTVRVDGERFVSLAVDRPPTTAVRRDGRSYTQKDGELLEVPSEIDAEIGGWPFSDRVSVSFGTQHKAEPLESLDLGPRALGRIRLEGDLLFHASERV